MYIVECFFYFCGDKRNIKIISEAFKKIHKEFDQTEEAKGTEKAAAFEAAILTARTLKADGLDVPENLELPMLEFVSKAFADGQTAAREKWSPIYKTLNGSDPEGDKKTAEDEVAKQAELIKSVNIAQHIALAKIFLAKKSTENQNPLVKRAQTNAKELLERFSAKIAYDKNPENKEAPENAATAEQVTEAVSIYLEVKHLDANSPLLKGYKDALQAYQATPNDTTKIDAFRAAIQVLLENKVPETATTETAPTEAPTENIEELLAKLQPEERESVAHELAEYEKGYRAGIEQARTGKGELGDEGDEEKTLAELGEQIGYLNSFLAQILFRVKDIPTETPNNATEEQKTTHAKYREKAVKIVRELAADTKVAILKTFSRTVPEAAEEKPEDAVKNLGQKWKSITFEQLKSGVSFLPKIDIEYLKTGEDNAHLYKIYTDAYAKLDSEAREDANISWQMGLAANAKFKREVKRAKVEGTISPLLDAAFEAHEKDFEALSNSFKNPFADAIQKLLVEQDAANADKIANLSAFKQLNTNYFDNQLKQSAAATPTATTDKKAEKEKAASVEFMVKKEKVVNKTDDKFALNFKDTPAAAEVSFKILSKNGKPVSAELNADYTKNDFGNAITCFTSKEQTALGIAAMGARFMLGNKERTQLVRPRLVLPFLSEILEGQGFKIKDKILDKLTELSTGSNPFSFTEWEKQVETVRKRVIEFTNKLGAGDAKGALSDIDSMANVEDSIENMANTNTTPVVNPAQPAIKSADNKGGEEDIEG